MRYCDGKRTKVLGHLKISVQESVADQEKGTVLVAGEGIRLQAFNKDFREFRVYGTMGENGELIF